MHSAASGQALDAVEVKGQALSETDRTFSSTRQEQQEIRDERVQRVQQLFRNVPGMNLTGYGLPGVADGISLRGFGGGGHGGDVGVVLDGIPLNEAMSHADGYADLNVVVPLEVGSMTVLRGPVSALYGNYHRGGSIIVDTRRGGNYRELDLSLGRFRSFDLQAAAGLQPRDGQQLNLAAQARTSDGFRPQSDGHRYTLAGRWSIAATQDLDVAISTRLHDASADNAGYLPRALFDSDPYGIDPRMKNDGSKKSFYTLRTDLNYRIGPDLKLLSFAYATEQDFSRWFTRGGAAAATWRQREETYDRRVLGAGINLNGQHKLAGSTLTWVLGVETFRERTDYLKYEDTDFRRRVGTAEFDRRFTLNNLAAFAEASWALHPLLTPTVGVRWDRFSGDCTIGGSETATDPCDALDRVSQASPKLGLRTRWSGLLETRVSVAEGFAIAQEMAKYALGTTTIAPNVFRQTEVGATLRLPASLMLDLAAYRLQSSDEITMVAPGIYENAGRTRRSGIELSALWAPTAAFDLSATYGTANSRIQANPDAQLIGNRVTSVPRNTATLSANWRPTERWKTSMVWRKVGAYAVDAANTIEYDGYNTLDFAIVYTLARATPMSVYFAVDNVSDRRYATSVSSVGYATGAPRTYRIGTQLSF